MKGKILGFDPISKTGTISGDDGNRYSFTKESFKEDIEIKKDTLVDFNTNENEAIDIYTIVNQAQENTTMAFGLISLALTFFLGFIGTLISRIVLSKQSFGAALIPTAIHFVITIILFIPIVGWIVYLIGTAYFMYKNYMLTTSAREA